MARSGFEAAIALNNRGISQIMRSHERGTLESATNCFRAALKSLERMLQPAIPSSDQPLVDSSGLDGTGLIPQQQTSPSVLVQTEDQPSDSRQQATRNDSIRTVSAQHERNVPTQEESSVNTRVRVQLTSAESASGESSSSGREVTTSQTFSRTPAELSLPLSAIDSSHSRSSLFLCLRPIRLGRSQGEGGSVPPHSEAQIQTARCRKAVIVFMFNLAIALTLLLAAAASSEVNRSQQRNGAIRVYKIALGQLHRSISRSPRLHGAAHHDADFRSLINLNILNNLCVLHFLQGGALALARHCFQRLSAAVDNLPSRLTTTVEVNGIAGNIVVWSSMFHGSPAAAA